MLIFVDLASSQTPVYNLILKIMDTAGEGSASHGDLPVYAPAFAGTHCASPRRDGYLSRLSGPGITGNFIT